MAGASTALCSPAVQSRFSYAHQPAANGVRQPFSISRLCLSNHQYLSLLCLRTHVSSSPACFSKARISLNGIQFNSSRSCRHPWFSVAASSDYSSSGNVERIEAEDSSKTGSEVSKSPDQTEEALNMEVSEVTEKGADSGKDVVLEAEAVKEDSSDAAKKFIGVLRDTTEELKEKAEKARAAFAVTAQETAAVLAATAQETAEKSKENLSYIAENAPDPIREIADTAFKAHSADTPKKFAKIHDFCLGIPYGSILVTGGLLWFIIFGSTAAIRFGVILGGILLGLSISSLNAWKEGKSTDTYIKGQTVISAILAFRQMRRLFEVKAFFPSAFFALISIGMLAFYSYVLLAGGNPPKKAKHAPAA